MNGRANMAALVLLGLAMAPCGSTAFADVIVAPPSGPPVPGLHTPATPAPGTSAAGAGASTPPARAAQGARARTPAPPRGATPPRNSQAAPPTPAGTRSFPGPMPQLAPVIGSVQGFEPAPLPNPDISAPITRGPAEAQIGATLTRRAQGFGTKGDGFSPGSSYSGYFDRRGRAVEGIGSTLAPSFQLRVPLE